MQLKVKYRTQIGMMERELPNSHPSAAHQSGWWCYDIQQNFIAPVALFFLFFEVNTQERLEFSRLPQEVTVARTRNFMNFLFAALATTYNNVRGLDYNTTVRSRLRRLCMFLF